MNDVENSVAELIPVPKPWPVCLIAHKGASAYCTQNTLPAFCKAVAMGAPAIELDVHMVDDVAVVYHNEDDIEDLCTTGIPKPVKKLSLDELRALELRDGSKPYGSVPTLKEALACINRKAIDNIHLKELSTGEGVEKVIKEFIAKKGWKPTDFLVSAFTKGGDDEVLPALRHIRKTLPDVPIAMIVKGYRKKGIARHLALARCLKACSLHIKLWRLKKNGKVFVDAAHAQNLTVYPYPVNDPQELKHLERIKVDGVTTDDPGIYGT